MTTPAQQLQEETIKALKERFGKNQYTLEQLIRMAYVSGRAHRTAELREDFGHWEDNPYV